MSLRLVGVNFTYGSDTLAPVAAVRDICFTIEEGEIVGLVGHTGSGKSTLAQLLCGLVRADQGEIWLDDLELVRQNQKKKQKKLKSIEVAKKIGMVFQYPEHQLFEETVAKEIAYGPENLGWDFAKIQGAIEDIAQKMGMTPQFLQKSPMALSGGEKRKVTLASILIMNPKFLVLDEPFVGLDCVAKEDFTRLLLSWQQEGKGSIICISHDMDQLACFCKRLLVMNQGALVIDAPIKQAFCQEKLLSEAGILLPTAKAFLQALAREGALVSTLPLTKEQAATEAVGWFLGKGVGKKHGN